MADSKLTELTENTTPQLTDIMLIVDDPGGTPASQKITLASIQALLNLDGWIAASETWTYAGADDPTFTFTISGDKTGKYSAGMRIKLTQTTVKYFIITAVSYGVPNTTVTVYGGTDYDLANAAISLNYYSMVKAPHGFPLDPTKWTVRVVDTTSRSQATAAVNTWYNLGSVSISIPIGVWLASYQVTAAVSVASQANFSISTTLSTANNSASDADWLSIAYWTIASNAATNFFQVTFARRKTIVAAAKTSYYINTSTTYNSSPTIYNSNGGGIPTILEAICAYL